MSIFGICILLDLVASLTRLLHTHLRLYPHSLCRNKIMLATTSRFASISVALRSLLPKRRHLSTEVYKGLFYNMFIKHVCRLFVSPNVVSTMMPNYQGKPTLNLGSPGFSPPSLGLRFTTSMENARCTQPAESLSAYRILEPDGSVSVGLLY